MVFGSSHCWNAFGSSPDAASRLLIDAETISLITQPFLSENSLKDKSISYTFGWNSLISFQCRRKIPHVFIRTDEKRNLKSRRYILKYCLETTLVNNGWTSKSFWATRQTTNEALTLFLNPMLIYVPYPLCMHRAQALTYPGEEEEFTAIYGRHSTTYKS